MDRALFLKLISSSAPALLLPGKLWAEDYIQDYTPQELIGKAPRDLVGSTYLTTMQRDTARALKLMQETAKKDGIEIKVVSAFRSFDRQKEIFENKFKRFTAQGNTLEQAVNRIIEYSTLPGTSRHHWGTDLDLIDGGVTAPESVLESRHYYGSGVFCALREWLEANAAHYGFYQVYTNHPDRKGFAHEPWHYSYAPVSIPMLKAFMKLDLEAILSEEKILGASVISGSFLAEYRKKHLLDINPLLLD
jgi:hypothetical protein